VTQSMLKHANTANVEDQRAHELGLSQMVWPCSCKLQPTDLCQNCSTMQENPTTGEVQCAKPSNMWQHVNTASVED
jgi:hypothetical protein